MCGYVRSSSCHGISGNVFQKKLNSLTYLTDVPRISYLQSLSRATHRAEARQNVQDSYGLRRIYTVSDLHTDYLENMEWVSNLSDVEYKKDALIVAGDIADCLTTFRTTVQSLKRKFSHVFFVPGNHELWCRRLDDPPSSMEKLTRVLQICEDEGIVTKPHKLENLWIIPIYSWHHQSFDREPDIEGFRIPSLEQVCMDYKVCKWPPHLSNTDTSLAQFFDTMNNANFKSLDSENVTDCQIISFSHFLPRQELCPEKRRLIYPHLPKMAGSDWLEARLRQLHGERGSPTACHIFGHTHFSWDATIDGIRYIQAPLAYPKERQRRIRRGQKELPLPLLLYDQQHNGFAKKQESHTSPILRGLPPF